MKRLPWTFWEVTRNLLILAAVAIAILIALESQQYLRKLNWGFGPDWDCDDAASGGLVCFKTKPPQLH